MNPEIVRRKWTKEEDDVLRIEGERGNDWAAAASLLAGRTILQCRTRWVMSLSPEIVRGKWKTEEDDVLRIEGERGNDWAAVARELPGRTNRQCRQRWITIKLP